MVALQPEVSCWLPGQVQATFQPVVAAVPVLVTVTVAVKPASHWLSTCRAAVQPLFPPVPPVVLADVPVLVPVEVPVLVPVEVPVDVPVLVPVDVPVLVPVEVPVDVPPFVPPVEPPKVGALMLLR